MKTPVINLRSSLSKFNRQKVRVVGVIECISSKRNKRGKQGRYVLLSKVVINNSVNMDHLWIPYKGDWHKFNDTKHRKVQVTFVGVVKRFQKGAGYKYIISNAARVETYANFKNPAIPSLKTKEKQFEEYVTPMDNMDVFLPHFDDVKGNEVDVKIQFELKDNPSTKIANTAVKNLTINGVTAKIGLVRLKPAIVSLAETSDNIVFEATAKLKLESRWVPWGKIIVKQVRNLIAIPAPKE